MESQPALKTHACDIASPCPVARGMDQILTKVNDRLQKVLESELQSMTVADLVAHYIARPA